MYISSINNEKIKTMSKLNSKKYRDQLNLFLIEGRHCIEEALKKNVLKEIFVLEGTENNYNYDTIKTTCISKLVMDSIYKLPSTPEVIGVCEKIKEEEIGNKVIILDNLQDPGNLGTIIRSAVAFNFDTIILSDDGIDLYNEKVVRSSEGMLFHINIVRGKLDGIISNLKQKNYLIIGTDVEKGKQIDELTIKTNVGIVIGNEGNGISNDIKSLCDDFIYINTNSNCESLNASVAASIIMYEVSK